MAHAGVPHYLGPRVSFIEVQEPSDLLVIAEAPEHDEPAATMGLGWDVALDMIDYAGQERGPTLSRAQQSPRVMRSSHGSREVRLFQDDVLEFFDATALEVTDNIDVDDGRFSIAIVTSGDGSIHGNFGDLAVRRGETFALPAHLPIRVAVGRATTPHCPVPRPHRRLRARAFGLRYDEQPVVTWPVRKNGPHVDHPIVLDDVIYVVHIDRGRRIPRDHPQPRPHR